MTCTSTTGLGYISLLLYLFTLFFINRSIPTNGTLSPMNVITVSLDFTIILAYIVIRSTTIYGVFIILVNSGLLSSYIIYIIYKLV